MTHARCSSEVAQQYRIWQTAKRKDFVEMKWRVADEGQTWEKLMMMVPAVRNALMIGRDRNWVTKPRRRKPRTR